MVMSPYISEKYKAEYNAEHTKSAMISAICLVTNVTLDEIASGTRRHPIPYARQLICWYLSKEKVPQPKIAEIVHLQDRSTVSSHKRTIDGYIKVNAGTVRKDIEKINEILLHSNADTKIPD